MADAPKSAKTDKAPSEPKNSSTGTGSSNPAPVNKSAKTADGAKGKSGKPVEDAANAQQAIRVDGIPASTGLGTLLEPWQARDELAKALNDLEALNTRVHNLHTHFDLSGLTRHVEGARKWLGEQLGLEVNKDGVLQRADGGSQLSSVLTSDTDEHKNADGDVKTPEGKAAGTK